MKHLLIETVGWYGVAAVLAAYALTSVWSLSSDGLWYPILNGTGALGMCWSAYTKRAYQPVVLNCIWFAIALISLTHIIFR